MKDTDHNKNWGGSRPGAGRKPKPKLELDTKELELCATLLAPMKDQHPETMRKLLQMIEKKRNAPSK